MAQLSRLGVVEGVEEVTGGAEEREEEEETGYVVVFEEVVYLKLSLVHCAGFCSTNEHNVIILFLLMEGKY